MPDPGFQKGTISTLNTASGLDQRSLLLGVGYVVLLLVVFVVGLGLVVYFARACKTTISGQCGPIPRKRTKGNLEGRWRVHTHGRPDNLRGFGRVVPRQWA